jgi:hypothetical protein
LEYERIRFTPDGKPEGKSMKYLVLFCSVVTLASALCAVPFGSGCTPSVLKAKKTAPAPAQPEAQPAVDLKELPKLSRDDFNRIAALMDLPLFWSQDLQSPGELEPGELSILGVGTKREHYIEKDVFTPNFSRIYRSMVERRRREAVARELDQGRPTLVHTDFKKASDVDKTIVRHITAAARIIEELYALQEGSFHLQGCLLPNHPPSQALFRRNQAPWCLAPDTENDPFCNACPDFPEKIAGLYPAELQKDKDMCKKLSDELLDPFVVVRGPADKPRAVPYIKEWGPRMSAVAKELKAAAGAIGEESEQAFKAYLLAAAKGFETNQWGPADEAWAAMNANNSKWYLRIAPDEVYFEPCSRKAGFHVSFARIDPDSLYWQEKLTPLRQEMEEILAKLIGKPYAARKVSVHLPDFIQIVLNAGDARSPMGATIGQSLPNWGKVAEEGRGRTVVMSNLYTDPDSKAILKERATSLLSKESMQYYCEDQRLSLLDIILHEAAHNFGPHSDHKIDGKRPGAIFGGPLASTLEELKSQTGALYYLEFLREKGVLKAEDRNRVYNHALLWCFGHISRGMFSPSGKPKPYSHVAAINVAWLARAGALTWEADQPAANGKDQGRFTIHYDKIPDAIEKLMQHVGRIKAKGDKPAAEKLIDDLIKGKGYQLVHDQEIKERILRHPKASFVYSVTF